MADKLGRFFLDDHAFRILKPVNKGYCLLHIHDHKGCGKAVGKGAVLCDNRCTDDFVVNGKSCFRVNDMGVVFFIYYKYFAFNAISETTL